MAAVWNSGNSPERRLLGLAGALLSSTALLTVFLVDLRGRQRPQVVLTEMVLRLVQREASPQTKVASTATRPAPSTERRYTTQDVPRQAEIPSRAVIENAVSSAPSHAASEPVLDLRITAAMAQDARGVGTLTRDNLAQLHANDPRSSLERGVDASRVPDCMSGDALKHQPNLMPYVSVSGLLNLPSWASAALTGKCKAP